eukprot:TRINITY_DN11910_c0_g1_i2.p1 TRINITY_DN11910_c0_g1~~TRINITY_DN11910_c0_g1_i2.p1  ORF type:complete len:415 (-),score=105.92 TRINITY_DN11910_c0_g1_i2:106-1350(-)
MKQLLRDPKLKIPTECSELLPKLLDCLSNPNLIDDKKKIIKLLKVLLSSSINSAFLANSVKQYNFLGHFLSLTFKEESLPIIKKHYKLLSLMLSKKSLCDLLISRHLPEIIERAQAHCRKRANDGQWEGLQIFLKALAKTWAPLPADRLHGLWETFLNCLCEKSKASAFHESLASLLSCLSPSVLYPLLKHRWKEVIVRLMGIIEGKDASINYARLLKKIIALNDIAADTFISLGGMDYLENILIPKWDPYSYKILSELCAKPRFIDKALKTSLIRTLINKISRSQANTFLRGNFVEEEKVPICYKQNTEGGAQLESNAKKYIKSLEKIIRCSKATQVERIVELGALEALVKYLNPSEPALDHVYETISDILKEGRQWGSDRQNPIVARAESIGLRRKIVLCTQRVGNPHNPPQ